MKTLFFLLASVACFAQPALITHVAATACPLPSTCTYPSSVAPTTITTSAINTTSCTPHCIIHVCYVASGSGTPSNPVSDNQSNTYSLAVQQKQGDVVSEDWYVLAPTLGASHTFTASGNGVALAVMAFSGVASGPDQVNNRGVYSPTPFTVPNITPTNNDELLVKCLSSWGANTLPNTVTPGTTVDQLAYNGGYFGAGGVSSGYNIQTTATSEGASWAYAGGGDQEFAGTIASFYSVESPAALQVTTTQVPEGFNGVAYGPGSGPGTNQLAATGGLGPYTWSCTSGCTGSGPWTITGSGVSISSAGLLTGTAVTGSYSFVVKATDTNSTTALSGTLTLTVATTALSITTTTCPAGTQLTAYAGCNLGGAGGTSPYTYSITNSQYYAALPEGLGLNTSTGAITSSEIGAQGGYVVNFVITDSVGAVGNQSITFAMAGNNAFGGNSLCLSNSIFCTDVSAAVSGLPVDTSPAASIYYTTAHLRFFFGSEAFGGCCSNLPNGMAITTVTSSQANAAMTSNFASSNSFAGPYSGSTCPTGSAPCTSQFPVPTWAGIEGSAQDPSDQHVLTVQLSSGGAPHYLFEGADGDGSCSIGGTLPGGPNGAVTSWSLARTFCANTFFDLTSYNLIPNGWTSSDAAGLPVSPLILNYDEAYAAQVSQGGPGWVKHPIRMTLNNTLAEWVWPARHEAGVGNCVDSMGNSLRGQQLAQPGGSFGAVPASCNFAGTGVAGPAIGEIYRLKASTSMPSGCSSNWNCVVVFNTLIHFGMILADNGSSIGLIGTSDSRWPAYTTFTPLTTLTGAAFEPVNVSSLQVGANSAQTTGGGGTAPVITSACPQSVATQGVAITPLTMTATGSTPISFSVSSGTLPSGVNLISGVISGTPLGSGTSNFQLQASNTAGNSTPQSCSMQIVPVSPTISAAGSIMPSGAIQ